MIATGAPNPAMPSRSAPNEKAMIRACILRSVVRVASALRTVSNLPVSIVRLCRKSAFMTIQVMGQKPNTAPLIAAESAIPRGIP